MPDPGYEPCPVCRGFGHRVASQDHSLGTTGSRQDGIFDMNRARWQRISRRELVTSSAAGAIALAARGATPAVAGAVESEGNSGGFNTMRGGKGDDKIKAPAGRGYNDIFGEDGNDVINAKNGAPDDIDCGPGRDTVSYDAALDGITKCEVKNS
jgi:hypothetical protein